MMRLCFARGAPDRLETLHPAYFALVMATGIVALAAWRHGIPILPTALFWLNLMFLLVLILATLMRMLRYRAAFAADLRDHSRAVGFFTVVAAFGVFSTQLVLQFGRADIAIYLWVATAILWFATTYGILALLTVKPAKPALDDGLNGGWLVIVVATQSLSVLTLTVLEALPAGMHAFAVFTSLVLWLGGGVVYLWLMTLIFFRYTFLRMSPADLTPPYWINMGAVAISTLAGAGLIEQAESSALAGQFMPFLKGLTLLFWSIGSWWIPMLLVLGLWRYLIRRVPFSYDPLYWGGVFPLGMYSVCTHRLAEILEVPFLMPLSEIFMVAAIAAWTATFVGLLETRLRRPHRSVPAAPAR